MPAGSQCEKRTRYRERKAPAGGRPSGVAGSGEGFAPETRNRAMRSRSSSGIAMARRVASETIATLWRRRSLSSPFVRPRIASTAELRPSASTRNSRCSVSPSRQDFRNSTLVFTRGTPQPRPEWNSLKGRASLASNQSSTISLAISRKRGKYTIPAGSQSANRMRRGNRNVSGRAVAPGLRRLAPADDPAAHAVEQPVQQVGVLHDLGAEERRAQDRRVRHLPAQPAAHAAVVDVRHRIDLERVAGILDGERGASGEPDAGVVARAHVLV